MRNSKEKTLGKAIKALLAALFALCLIASASLESYGQDKSTPDNKNQSGKPQLQRELAPEPSKSELDKPTNSQPEQTPPKESSLQTNQNKSVSDPQKPAAKTNEEDPGKAAIPGADRTAAQQSTETETGNESSAEKQVPQNQPASKSTKSRSQSDKENGAPLIIGKNEIFRVKVKLGPYTPELRVEAIQERLKRLEDTAGFNPATIKTSESPISTDIVCGDTTILTLTDLDAEAVGFASRQALAARYAALMRDALQEELDDQSLPKLFQRIGLSILLSMAAFLGIMLSNRLFPWLYDSLAGLRGKVIKSLKFQNAVLLNEGTIIDIGVGFLRVVRLLTVFSVLMVYLTTVLSLFPQTRNLSSSIVQTLTHPFINIIIPAVISYLPNLLFISAILVCSYYIIGFTRFIFSEVERSTITIPGFDPEWSTPTYKIVRFLLIAFALVLVFPYLPGSGSPAFQQVSLFLGILLSLASSGAVAHLVAGVFLTYTGAFRVGDRVKIADTVGDVVEKTLLATRVRTIKQEVITIPNGLVLSSHIVNYSSSAVSTGLILHTTVTIGYDASWKQVHELLIEAALATGDIMPEPRPFVFQTSLDDYYVSYQINAYTRHPEQMADIYSRLHQNIQDKFNEAGVEILSPRYSSMRDGNKTTIPEDYLPQDYKAPQFGVSLNQLESK